MTIERYTSREGISVTNLVKVEQQVLDLRREGRDSWKVLPAGEYDLTPQVWKDSGSNLYFYHLIVNEDGTGVYQMLPKDAGVRTQELTGQGLSAHRAGGRIFRLPEDNPTAVVIGPKRGDNTIRIFEIARYVPGPSPIMEDPELSSIKEQVKESAQDQEDIISEPITNLPQAERLIIEDVAKRVEALDWNHFGQLEMAPGKIFEATVDLILRNAGMNFPLNLLDESKPQENAILNSLPQSRKKKVVDRFWRVLLTERLEPQGATFIRDWLYVKAPETIAGMNKLSPMAVILHFSGDAAFRRAGLRLARGMGLSTT